MTAPIISPAYFASYDPTLPVRKKAAEIANNLIGDQQLDREKAMSQAVKKAQDWFIKLEG